MPRALAQQDGPGTWLLGASVGDGPSKAEELLWPPPAASPSPFPLLPCLVSQCWDCQSCQIYIFQDWSKLPIYEQPGANALQRRKDRVELLREADPSSASLIYPGLSLEDGPRPRLSPASIAAKVRPGPRKRPWVWGFIWGSIWATA